MPSARLEPLTSKSPEQTRAAGEELGRTLVPGDVVALHGDLGAGKTTFVQGVVAGMGGSTDFVSSPTFAIVHTYETPRGVVHHFDGYRIESEDELDEFGFDEYLDGSAIIVIEWPARLRARLPDSLLNVELRHAGAEIRTIQRIGGFPDIGK